MASVPADTPARWRRSPDLAVVDSDGRAAVLNLAYLDQDPLILEGTAHAIWRALGEHDDLEAINRIVSSEFDVDPADTRDQVSAFLATLAAAGVLWHGGDSTNGTPADKVDIRVRAWPETGSA